MRYSIYGLAHGNYLWIHQPLLYIYYTSIVAPASLQFDEFLSRINRGYNLLSVERFSDKTAHWAIIHGEMTTATPISTRAPIHNPRMIVQALHNDTDIKFTFEANFTTVSSGRVSDDTFDDLMQSMLPDSSYYLCPGMPLDLVEKCTFEAKNARKWMPPFQRIDHTECEQWFKNVSQRSIAPTCNKCLKLRHYLYNEVKRRAAVTSVQLAQRTLPTSRCPIKHLTPSMREKRMALLRLKKNE